MILAGDIGGTNTRLALVGDDPCEPVALEIYPSAAHASLEEMVGAFLVTHPAHPRAACFGIAGPVRDGHVRVTNLFNEDYQETAGFPALGTQVLAGIRATFD